jgi:MATE family multidrug resistance protein
MGAVDAAVLGRYSEAALAGAGVGNNLLFAVTAVGLGVVMGMDTVVPQALGAGRRIDARRAVGAGVRLAVLVGLLCTLVVFFTPLLLDAASVDPEVVREATPYVYLRAVGIVPFLMTSALRSYLAAHSRTRPLIVAVIGGNLANFGLDVALIFGAPRIGLPALGVLGAATATTVVQLLTLAVYAAGVKALDNGEVRPRSTRADVAAIARVGIPVGGQIFAEVGIFGIATMIAAHLGKLSAAGHAIALNAASVTFAVSVGIGSATSVRVGLAAGSGDLALARQRGLLGIWAGLAVTAGFAALFILTPEAVVSAFTDQPNVMLAAVPLLQIAALFQLSDGAQAVAAGALRGLGRTSATLWGNVVGHYAVGLPVSLLAGFSLSMGIAGVWWGLSAGLTVTALYLVAMFLKNTS